MNPELVANLLWTAASLVALFISIEQLFAQRRLHRKTKVIDSASLVRVLKRDRSH